MTWKRIVAYFIDLIFVVLLIELLEQIRFLNPSYDEYYDASQKYNDVYNDIVENGDIKLLTNDEYNESVYELQRTRVSYSIIEIVVYLLYFVGFQWWNKGQTLGKKAMRIKVADVNDNNVKWYQLVGRSIILYDIYSEIILVILVFIVGKSVYVPIYNILSVITSIILGVSFFMIIFRKDKRGLHDLIAGTKVVSE